MYLDCLPQGGVGVSPLPDHQYVLPRPGGGKHSSRSRAQMYNMLQGALVVRLTRAGGSHAKEEAGGYERHRVKDHAICELCNDMQCLYIKSNWGE